MAALGYADSAGEIVTYPTGDERCVYQITADVCAAPDSSGNYLYNKNSFRDVSSDLDRYNVFLYVNHEMQNGVEAFTELSWYQAKSNFNADASYLSIGASDIQIGPDYYYNPFGPCLLADGSPNPNRIAEADEAGIVSPKRMRQVCHVTATDWRWITSGTWRRHASRLPITTSSACCRASAALLVTGIGRQHSSGRKLSVTTGRATASPTRRYRNCWTPVRLTPTTFLAARLVISQAWSRR
jgi:hypothetical protein